MRRARATVGAAEDAAGAAVAPLSPPSLTRSVVMSVHASK